MVSKNFIKFIFILLGLLLFGKIRAATYYYDQNTCTTPCGGCTTLAQCSNTNPSCSFSSGPLGGPCVPSTCQAGGGQERDSSQNYCEATASGCGTAVWDSTTLKCCGDDGTADNWSTPGLGSCQNGVWHPECESTVPCSCSCPAGISCSPCPDPTGKQCEGGLVPCGRKYDDPCTKNCECTPCTLCHIFVLFKRIVDFVTIDIIFPLAILMIVVGGVMLLTAGGDPGRIGGARKILTATIIGLVIILAAWLIVDTVIMFLVPASSPFQNWNTINCPLCGDGTCDPGETQENCPVDCGYVCVPPACPGAGSVDCGQAIMPNPGCPPCPGTGTKCDAGQNCIANVCVAATCNNTYGGNCTQGKDCAPWVCACSNCLDCTTTGGMCCCVPPAPPPCIPHAFVPATSTVSPNSAKVNDPLSTTCDYGIAGIDCIDSYVGPNQCLWSGWDGTKAQFSCTAPATPGTYTHVCKLNPTRASNCCSQTNNNGSVTVTANTLTVVPAGSGSGKVTSDIAGIDCGATCSAPYSSGTAVKLTAVPSAGSIFVSWSGGGCAGIGNCTVTMNADITVTATFNLITACTYNRPDITLAPTPQQGNLGDTKTYTITVTNKDTAACPSSTFTYSVSSCPTDWTCDLARISIILAPGDPPDSSNTLTVTPANTGAGGYNIIVEFQNAASSLWRTGTAVYNLLAGPPSLPHVTATAPAIATVNTPFTVTETYTHDTHANGGIHLRWADAYFNVNTVAGCNNIISGAYEGIECSDIPDGTVKTFTLTPQPAGVGNQTLFARAWDLTQDHPCGGGIFDNDRDPPNSTCSLNCRNFPADWAVCDAAPLPITVNSPTSYTLTINKPGGGSGKITSAPAGIDCGATCSAPYNNGNSVTLFAAADAGSIFAGWSGGVCSGTNVFCTFTMTANTTVTATFNAIPNATAVNDAPDPVTVGNPVTFTGNWAEPDAGDLDKMYVCKDAACTNCNNTSQANCWCYSSAFNTQPDTTDTCSYTAQAADVGAKSYWLGVCDDQPSCDATPLAGGTFTVSAAAGVFWPHVTMTTPPPANVTVGVPFNVTLQYTHDDPAAMPGGIMLRWPSNAFDITNMAGCTDYTGKNPPYAPGWEGIECSNIAKGTSKTFTLVPLATGLGGQSLYYRAWDLPAAGPNHNCGTYNDYGRDPQAGTCSTNCDGWFQAPPVQTDWPICDSRSANTTVIAAAVGLTQAELSKLGDITGPTPGVPDCKINATDSFTISLLFSTTPASPNWNPNADLNKDNVVDSCDVSIVQKISTGLLCLNPANQALLTKLGDITGPTPGVPDCKINATDSSAISLLLGTTPASPNWNPNADLNKDNVVDNCDVSIIGKITNGWICH